MNRFYQLMQLRTHGLIGWGREVRAGVRRPLRIVSDQVEVNELTEELDKRCHIPCQPLFIGKNIQYHNPVPLSVSVSGYRGDSSIISARYRNISRLSLLLPPHTSLFASGEEGFASPHMVTLLQLSFPFPGPGAQTCGERRRINCNPSDRVLTSPADVSRSINPVSPPSSRHLSFL